MKNALLILLLLATTFQAMALNDTAAIPQGRKLFHDKIKVEQNLLDRADGARGIGRIENDGHRLVGDGGIDQGALGVRVAGMGSHRCGVAQAFGSGLGDVAFGQPVWVGRVVDDDGDQAAGLGKAWHDEGSAGGERREG